MTLSRTRNLLKNIKHNLGFTLMEVIIVVAIISVMLGLGAVGISQYINDADRNERNAAAEIIFMSLQSSLVQRQKDGTLQEFNDLVDAYQGTSHLATLLDYRDEAVMKEDTLMGNILSKNGLLLDTSYKQKHDGTKIVSVFYDGKNDRNTSLYSMLFALGVDDEYLKNKIVFEYNQTTGVVQAVFYSKEEGITFHKDSYQDGNLLAENNLLARDEDSLEDKKQGYYGLFETAAISEKIKEIIESSVQLVNDDRVYLVFEEKIAGDGYGQSPQITVDLVGESTRTYKVEWNNTGTNPNSSLSISGLMDALASQDLSRKNSGTDSLQGYYFKLKEDNKVLCLVLLSSEKVDRMTQLIQEGVFGLAPEKSTFYCRLASATSGVTANSNEINPVFADYNAAKNIYSISCVRHVLNMTRLDALKQSITGALNRPDEARSLHYQVTADINFCQYEREEHTILNAVAGATGKTVEEVLAMSEVTSSNGNLRFLNNLSVSDVAFNETDTNKTIHLKKGIFPLHFDRNVDLKNSGGNASKFYFTGILESDSAAAPYTISGIYLNAEKTGEFYNGFFRKNEGTIQNLNFSNAVILSRSRGGIVCGKNDGTIENVSVSHFLLEQKLASDHETQKECFDYAVAYSDGVMGTNGDYVEKYTPSYLGGVTGYSTKPMKSCQVEDGIISATDSVVGGVVGYMSYPSANETDYALDNCAATNCFIVSAAKAGGIVGQADGIINNCHTKVKDGGEIAAKSLLAYRNTTTDSSEALLANNGYNQYNPYLIVPTVSSYRNKGRVGGIAGVTLDGILNCSNEALVLQRFLPINNAFDGSSLLGVGGIVGASFAKGQISLIANCENKGLVIAYNSFMNDVGKCARFVGGIAGATFLSIDQCTNYAEVKAYNAYCVGGIAGGCSGDVTKCENYASVSARQFVGGIVGLFNGSVMEDCVNGGTLSADGSIQIVDHIKYQESWGGIITGELTSEAPVITGNYANVSNGYFGPNNIGSIGGLIGSCNAGAYQPATKTFVSNDYGTTIKRSHNGDLITIGVGGGTKPAGIRYLGGLVGYAKNGITIEAAKNFADVNVFKDWTNTMPANGVGGILGFGNSFVNLTDVANLGSLVKLKELYETGTMYGVSGVIGHATGRTECRSVLNRASVYIESVYSTNDNNTVRFVGGVLGFTNNDFIGDNITSTGEICLNQSVTTVQYIGGIAGYVNNNLICENITGTGGITLKQFITKVERIGGIAGHVKQSATVSHVNCNGSIKLENQGTLTYAGGIIGSVELDGLFTDVHYGTNLLKAEITAAEPVIECKNVMKYCGGIAGYVKGNASFTETTSTGSLHRTNWGGDGYVQLCVAGIAGQVSLNASFTNVWNAGVLDSNGASQYVGGVAGNIGGYFLGNQVFNTGSIKGTGTFQYVGGLVGRTATAFSLTTGSNGGSIHSDGGILDRVAGVVGQVNTGNTTLSGVINYGTITTGTWEKCSYVAGVAGQINAGSSSISGVTNYGAITTNGIIDHVAGVVGQIAKGDVAFASVTNYGNIKTAGNCFYVAGIVGEAKGSSTFINVLNVKGEGMEAPDLTTTNGTMEFVGGIAGRLTGIDETHTIRMEGIINEASIYAAGNASKVAGIAGEINLAPATLKNVTTYGEIRMTNYVTLQRSAGIVGYAFSPLTMENVYNVFASEHSYNARTYNSISSPTNMKYVGGLVGQAEKDVTLTQGENTALLYMSNGGEFNYIGGFFGEVKGNLSVSDSKNSGAITINNDYSKAMYIAGLCGNCQSNLSVVRSQNLAGGSITVGYGEYIAGIAGKIKGTAFFQEVLNQANITLTTTWADYAANRYIAGLAGSVGLDAMVSNAVNEGKIEAYGAMQTAAGIVAYISSGKNTFQNVDNKGNIIAAGIRQSGGVLAQMPDNVILSMDQVYNYGMLQAKSSGANDLGGIIGKTGKADTVSLTNCGNYGMIWLQSPADQIPYNIGGIVGYCPASPVTISSTLNKGNILSDYHLKIAGGIIGHLDGNCQIKMADITNSGNITATNGNLSQVGGIIGNCEGENGRAFYNLTAEGTIQGRNLSNVGGLIGFLHGSAGSYINGAVDNATENTAEYKPVNVNIKSMQSGSTWEYNTVGGLVGKVNTPGNITIRNYSYEGTMSSENPGVTGMERLVGSIPAIDITTYHLRYYATVAFEAADAGGVYTWEGTTEGKYVFGGSFGKGITEDHTITFRMPAGNAPSAIKLDGTILSVTITKDAGDPEKYSFVLPKETCGGTLTIEYTAVP